MISHHAVPGPLEDATWLIPHHLQASTLLHCNQSVIPNKGLFPFSPSSLLPPPQVAAQTL